MVKDIFPDMLVTEIIPIPIVLVLFFNGGSGDKCEFSSICMCRKIGGQLFADCSNKKLTKAPVFSDDVIGINLSKNRFSKIPQTLPAKLLFLDMSGNQLLTLDNTSFERYRLIQNLSVSGNILTEVSLGTFQSNSELKHLDVSFNKMLTIEAMYNVSFDLRKSEIQTLNFAKLHCTYGVSQNLQQYHVVYLKHTKLRELNVASNRISSLELGALSLLPKSLRVLDIADNVLTFGFYMMEFAVLYNLEILNVSFQDSFHQVGLNGAFAENCNDTRKIGPCVSVKGTVEDNDQSVMDRKINKGSLFPDLMNNVFTTVLDHTYIDGFPKATKIYTIYLPRNLRKLYYHDNLYKMSIPSFPFSPNNKLTHVFGQQNIIYELVGPVTGVTHVLYMDLSGNFCKFISKTFFRTFSNLEFLNLSNNALSQTFENENEGELFMNQRWLSILDLSLNRITHLPKNVFRYNDNLQRLDISYNSLSEFRVNIHHMKNLSNLNLSNNQLVQLSFDTREALDHLKSESVSVHLSGNNLKCSCETIDFLKWMRDSKKINFVGIRDYVCSLGRNSTFENLDGILQQLEKECSSYTLIIVLMTTLIIITMTITMSRILYRFRWKLRYMYYVAKEKYKEEKNHVELGDKLSYRFDAFISYADQDRKYIIDLVKSLEKNNALNLCIHSRDFIPGTGIADNITNAIHCSRRTVCFMTKHFLDSYWCMFELNMARMEAIYSRNGQNVLFLVALEKGIMKHLPLQLMDLVDSHSYLDSPVEGAIMMDTEASVAFLTKLGETLSAK